MAGGGLGLHIFAVAQLQIPRDFIETGVIKSGEYELHRYSTYSQAKLQKCTKHCKDQNPPAKRPRNKPRQPC